ncbi:unnamed protein product [Cylindrotheca closterium]|uniref:Uncharacterized protein n=1 Tax=Cylindrotheca closterium TaxID=2856 RepID=A0AAD2CB11_9STRA|nr:unnamed protein product [Cylindrotheca closterium]
MDDTSKSGTGSNSSSPSLLIPTPLVASEESKACLSNAVEVFQELFSEPFSSSQDYPQISTLLELHDRLSHLLLLVHHNGDDDNDNNNNNNDKIPQSIARYFSQLRLQRHDDNTNNKSQQDIKKKQQLFEYLAVEADLYRAMALTSIYLMEMIPTATNRPLDVSVEQGLKSCYQRAQFLVKMMDHRVVQSVDVVLVTPNQEINSTSSSSSLLLDHYTTDYSEQLERWLLECDSLEENDDNNNNSIMMFDKEQLQLEEDELMQMAATPTPNETEDDSAILPSATTTYTSDRNSPTDLSARLIQYDDTSSTPENDDSTDKNKNNTSQYSTLVVLNDRGGVFQSQHPQEQAWWWALTSDSTIQCDHHANNDDNNHDQMMITISSVVSNRPKLGQHLPFIQLHAKKPQDVSLWWSRISKIVQSLQETKDLQHELESLWPAKEVQTKLEESRLLLS